ncbi:MAG: outer membrane beta-barrel protein [Verrucomicrobia bacterium]|nr:outer membrane beta-barrel protein [Verrucomicrobiota bacterium]MCH8512782.1 porin family protein [Kiritimatiellia bacterium]
MKKHILCLICILAPLFSHAQMLKLNKGDFEIAGSATVNSNTIGFETRFGAFVADYIQTGINAKWADTNFGTRAAFNLYMINLFETRTYFIPYAGASIGFGSLDYDFGGSESGVEFQLIGGVKYYFADNVSLNTELTIGISSGETFQGNNEMDDTEIALRVGLGFLW